MLRHSLVSLSALFAAVALAQPPSPPPPAPLSVTQYGIAYLGNEQLADELKLTPDQREKLKFVVFSGFSRITTQRTFPDFRKNEVERTEKDIDTILKLEQRARLRQVILQHLARVPAGPDTLAADAGLVAKLGLSDDQLKKLQARSALPALLTPEQAKTWGELTGPAFPHRLVLRNVGFGAIGFPPPR